MRNKTSILVNGKRYGKYDGMLLAMEIFPELCPWRDVVVVEDKGKWEEIQRECGDFATIRVDVPIGQRKLLKDVNTRGFIDDIGPILKTIKGKCRDAVVLVAKTETPPMERYLDDGGFNIGIFDDGSIKQIVIEVVGKGFDGHEVTRGISAHERWVIPYDQKHVYDLKCGVMSDAEYSGILPRDYSCDRKRRIKFLTEDLSNTTGITEAAVSDAIPEGYVSMEGSLMLTKLLRAVGSWLHGGMEGLELSSKVSVAIQGNFINGSPEIWGLFLPEYWS